MKNFGLWILMAFVLGVTSCKKDHCSNGKNDADETGVDCGGKDCNDCESCFDGIRNQGETEIDCGGPCDACPLKWTEVRTGSLKFTAVDFYQNVGLAVGENGLIVKSTDSGKTWAALNSGVSSDLWAVQLLDKDNYFLSGKEDVILVSSNGTSFTKKTTGKTADWNDIYFIDTKVGTICGSDLRIMYTTNGGKTWGDKISPKPSFKSAFVSMSFISEMEGYVIGGKEHLKTIDGGQNWIEIDGFSISPEFSDFRDLYYKTTSDIYCITESGMFISQNSTLWADKLQSVSGGNIDFLGRYGLYSGQNVSKSEGKVLISSDGGIHWENQSINKSIEYTNGIILSEYVMVVVGDKGTIIRRDK